MVTLADMIAPAFALKGEFERAGRNLHLSLNNAILLSALLKARPQPIAHDCIEVLLWGDTADGAPYNARDIVRVMMVALKRQLEGTGNDISAVRGFGYIMRTPASNSQRGSKDAG